MPLSRSLLDLLNDILDLVLYLFEVLLGSHLADYILYLIDVFLSSDLGNCLFDLLIGEVDACFLFNCFYCFLISIGGYLLS